MNTAERTTLTIIVIGFTYRGERKWYVSYISVFVLHKIVANLQVEFIYKYNLYIIAIQKLHFILLCKIWLLISNNASHLV